MRLTLLCLILSHAATQAQSGVWEQMERGEASQSQGIVKDVRQSGMDVIVTIETKDKLGNTIQSTSKLCREPSTQWPDYVQAAAVNSQKQDLEQKKKSETPIQFGQTGPFNNCISFVK